MARALTVEQTVWDTSGNELAQITLADVKAYVHEAYGELAGGQYQTWTVRKDGTLKIKCAAFAPKRTQNNHPCTRRDLSVSITLCMTGCALLTIVRSRCARAAWMGREVATPSS